MILALSVTAVVLVLLALSAGVLDRRCAQLAERKAGEYLSAPFGHPATVRVQGGPFLLQAVRGVYRDVEVAGSLRVGDIAGADLVARLTNVHLPLRDLLRRRARELPAERVAGHVVLPYAGLAALTRIPGLVLTLEGDGESGRLMASAALPLPIPLPMPGFGQLARVGGEAVLTLHEDGGVWLAVRGLSLAGVSLAGLPLSSAVLELVLTQLVPSLTVPIPLPPLPYGLQLDGLTPTAAGLVVDGSADAVVFRHTAAGGQPSGER